MPNERERVCRQLLEAMCDSYFMHSSDGMLDIGMRALKFLDDNPLPAEQWRDDIGDPGVHDKDPATLNDGLYDADPNCKHDIATGNGGSGIKCKRCRGWFCF